MSPKVDAIWYDGRMTLINSNNTHTIQDAHFVKGIKGTDPIVDEPKRHIAFVGRSNVGKSSVINFVLGRNNLVRSSSRPGKTTEINFFLVEGDYYFVDLPGYGFARMGERQREKLRKLILWYLMYTNVHNRLTFVVLDAQVGLTDFDREIITVLQSQNEQVCVIANKIDRLNQKQKHALSQKMQSDVSVPVIMCSATKSKGHKEIWQTIIGS